MPSLTGLFGFDEGKNKEEVYSKENLDLMFGTKVDKVPGKGLSTYDYDDTEKAKFNTKQNQHTTVEITIPSNNWFTHNTYFVNSISHTEDSKSYIFLRAKTIEDAEEYFENDVMLIMQSATNYVFYAKTKPTNDIALILTVLD